MAKEILRKELVFIDFETKEARFYRIELLSVGYNQIQLITTQGNFNNKGRVNIHRFDGKNAYKEASKLAYRKMFEKKDEGYAETVDVKRWHAAFDDKGLDQNLNIISKTFSPPKTPKTASASAKKPPTRTPAPPKETRCNECDKFIKKEMYTKIDDWARGEGNWDADRNFIGYQKVLCIECQIEHDIFKKKM